MAEVAEESTHVWSSKPRTVMFLGTTLADWPSLWEWQLPRSARRDV
jgi:hypothetical protein